MIPGTNRPWPLDKRGQPWPRSRFGQPLRPLDEYPPGVRAPGEGYTGPIADPEKAMRDYAAFMAEGGGLGKVDADPYAPIKAYLSARDVWENPPKYAGYPRPEAPAAKPAPKPPSDSTFQPKAPRENLEPEVVQIAAPLLAAPFVAALGAAAAGALLGGALGNPPPPAGAKRPRTSGRGTTPPLPPPPGFSEVQPPGAVVEGYDAASAGPMKLPTPATKAEPQIEYGPAVDAENVPQAVTMAPPWRDAEKTFSIQKQDGHIADTPQHKQRLRASKPTSIFDVRREEAYKLVQEAWEKGTPVPDRPGVRDHDFGRRVGTAPDGRGQTKIRVHQGADGRIHGHPAGS